MRLVLSVFLIFSVVTVGAAQGDAKSVFYKVSGNGIEKASYIYGIINFLPEDQYNVPKLVKSAMKDCDIFATKIVNNHSSQKKFNQAVRIKNNGWINDYLTDDELNQLRLLLLKDFEVKEHVYHDFYSRLQPIILVTATTGLWLDDNIVYVEEELSKFAKRYRMDQVGLGRVQEEIEAFEQFPIEDQVEALKYTVNNFDQHIEDYKKLVDDYLIEQDMVKVKDETMKATNESKAFKKVYYDARVKNWMPEIRTLIDNKSTFIALGVPYLVGEVSLLELLKEEGYTVTPLNVDTAP